jgi:hypothetical protein
MWVKCWKKSSYNEIKVVNVNALIYAEIKKKVFIESYTDLHGVLSHAAPHGRGKKPDHLITFESYKEGRSQNICAIMRRYWYSFLKLSFGESVFDIWEQDTFIYIKPEETQMHTLTWEADCCKYTAIHFELSH